MGLRRVPVYIYKRRRSSPKKSLAALALFRGTPSARRRYRHTSQQPNRPKNTKNNRAPKKYRRTFWEEEAERSNRGGLRKQTARKAQFTATRARRSGAFALTRLRIAPRIPPRDSRFSAAFQFAFGIFAIVSLLTCPMYSPSSQQPKESARINFLPSSP